MQNVSLKHTFQTNYMAKIPRKSTKHQHRPYGLCQSSEPAADRLVEVGTRLFATRGCDGTSIRDLADAAGVNVAAVHYYFGGKEQLYAVVIQHVFAGMVELRALLEEELRVARVAGTREAARIALGRCVRALVGRLISNGQASWAGAYLQRESMQPTAAMKDVINAFIKPAWDTVLALLALLRPDLADSDALHFISSSIVGQCLYYQQDLPVALATHGLVELGPTFEERAATHITTFSLCAIDRYPNEEFAP